MKCKRENRKEQIKDEKGHAESSRKMRREMDCFGMHRFLIVRKVDSQMPRNVYVDPSTIRPLLVWRLDIRFQTVWLPDSNPLQ